MLFPVNRETRKLIAVIRDLLFLIAVNCVQDPPPPFPYGPSSETGLVQERDQKRDSAKNIFLQLFCHKSNKKRLEDFSGTTPLAAPR